MKLTKTTLIIFVTLVIGFMVGGVILINVIGQQQEDDLRQNGTTAEAPVTDKEIKTRTDRSSQHSKRMQTKKDHYITVTLPEETRTISVESPLYDATPLGSTLTVCYTPENIRINFPDCAN